MLTWLVADSSMLDAVGDFEADFGGETVPKLGLPVTVISGFQGSGKTTLLNQIFQNYQVLKVAVLVNEFGDININSQFLVSIDEDMIELSNRL